MNQNYEQSHKKGRISLMQEIFGKESLGAIAPFLDNIELVKLPSLMRLVGRGLTP